MLTLCLLFSCSMPLQAEDPTTDASFCDATDSCALDTTRKLHHKICARELTVCNYASTGCLNVCNNALVKGNLAIAGNETVGGNTIVGDNETIAGSLTVAGDMFVTGSLFVDGVDLTEAITGVELSCTPTGSILSEQVGNILRFKCLAEGDGISFSSDATTITINATATVIVEPVVTSTIGGILGYAYAANYDELQTVTSTGFVTFNLTSTNVVVLPPGAGLSAFTIPAGNDGTYYFEYQVRGTPTAPVPADALTPPAPLVFQLLANGVALPFSQFASDTQFTTLVGGETAGRTLAVNGSLLAAIAGTPVDIVLQNITGFDVILEPTAQIGATPGVAAVNASLFVEKIALP